MPSENANQKGKAERKLFQAAGGQSRKEQKHCKSGGEEEEEGKGDFYRKTTLHIEGKMHKAQRTTTPKDDTLMLLLTFATTDRTKRGKIQE